MNETRNYILAIVLSLVVLIGWQFFIAGPQLERAQRQAEFAQQDELAAGQPNLPVPGATPLTDGSASPA
ncbi:MAG: membrane protein insertase YidC, partial [Cucumibacter sp.]